MALGEDTVPTNDTMAYEQTVMGYDAACVNLPPFHMDAALSIPLS